ncbi:MAG: polysaccharide deacetylase family protein [Clostridia bacterium]|nr:polysaccharide deacetylase family protein [Clostridia bacterium]
MRYRFLRFPDGKSKAVTFSYDDGCRDDIRLAETLARFGLKGTFNLNGSFLGKDEGDWHLTPDEIRSAILDKGFEIAVHGAAHRANGLLRPIEGIRDVLDCRLALEKIFGGIIRGMAYPDSGINNFQNGSSYAAVDRYLSELDIAYARTTVNDPTFRLPTDWHAWNPTCHHSDPDAEEKIDRFLSLDPSPQYTALRFPRLLYIWGHSFEFPRMDNWDLLDRICGKLAAGEGIWRATNMEIYEYVRAYESLIFSADQTRAFNPTLRKIWFEVDAAPYAVEPGETVAIAE